MRIGRPSDLKAKWLDQAMAAWLQRQRPAPGRKPRKEGGGEAVAVEPDRPRQGEGGAAAPLEFDTL